MSKQFLYTGLAYCTVHARTHSSFESFPLHHSRSWAVLQIKMAWDAWDAGAATFSAIRTTELHKQLGPSRTNRPCEEVNHEREDQKQDT